MRITGITTAGFGAMGSNYPTPDMLHPEEAAKENNPPSSAGLIAMAPEGDQALAQVGTDLFVVTVPQVGGEAPSIRVGGSSSSFPTKKLTDIGGQFTAWSWDADRAHWSIGNAHVIYDLEAAEAYEDSVEAAKEMEAEEEEESDPEEESEEEADEAKEEEKEDEGYKPQEIKISVMADRDIPEGELVLRGATVITMDGDEIIENADLVIRNNRIVGVGARGEVEIPSGADIKDVSGKTIIPGFVDTHAHF
ncbi:MAG TPA: amidohydrolase, partial [Balneolaceae bacterium]|nr:amidohydrolase [Balneolaceae bacterium]